MELQPYKDLQAEVGAWALRNFGVQDSHRPLLGVFEEIGELARACDHADLPEIRDAIGDICIYTLHYCDIRGWSFEEIFDGRVRDETLGSQLAIVEKLSHHHLKGAQGIRGKAEVHDYAMKHTFGHLFWFLETVAEDAHVLFHACLQESWNQVRLRDWKKNPNDAAKVAASMAGRAEEDARVIAALDAAVAESPSGIAELGRHVDAEMSKALLGAEFVNGGKPDHG